MSYKNLLFEVDYSIALITINRPEKLNPLLVYLYKELLIMHLNSKRPRVWAKRRTSPPLLSQTHVRGHNELRPKRP